MQTDHSHKYNPATVTFALQERDIQNIYKKERKTVNRHYIFGLIIFAAIAAATYFLEVKFLPWIAGGMAAMITVVYLIVTLIAKHNHKKQMKLWKIKLYNFSLRGEWLHVAMKDDRSAFHQHTISTEKVKISVDEEYLSFRHDGKLYVIPNRVLSKNSPFLQLPRI